MRVASMLFAIAGCGRVGFEARTGDGGGGDANVDARACTFGAWSTPQKVDDLSSPAPEYGGQITGDGLAYYFHSERTGLSDIWVAHRNDPHGTFATPARVDELSMGMELDASVSDDELDVYWTSERTAGFCIWHADRAVKTDPFANLTRLDALCTSNPAAGAFVTPDRTTMLYVRMDGQNYEGTIMKTTRLATTDPWVEGVPIAELAGGGFDKGYPVLAADGLELFFDGGLTHHLYHATRATTSDPWSGIEMIPNVNLTGNDEDPSVTTDGLELYFGSTRAGSAGDDIYRSTRTCD